MLQCSSTVRVVMVKQIPELSRSEYTIMQVLWKQGKQTIREVHDQVAATTNWAYTTTKTMMDRMVKKGLLKRSEFHGIYLYESMISRTRGLAKFIQFFANRVLEMDHSVVIHMLSQNNQLSEKEIQELEDLLHEMDGEDHE